MDRIANLARVLAEMREPESVEHLLRKPLTQSEAEKLSLRWDFVRLLSEGNSQRTIAHQFFKNQPKPRQSSGRPFLDTLILS